MASFMTVLDSHLQARLAILPRQFSLIRVPRALHTSIPCAASALDSLLVNPLGCPIRVYVALIGSIRLARATRTRVDPTEFTRPEPDAAPEDAVTLADGSVIPALGIVDVPLSIQGYKETVRCVVIDLSEDYDIILGDGWLYDHAGVIDYRRGHLRVVSRGREITLGFNPVSSSEPQARPGPSPSCTCWQAFVQARAYAWPSLFPFLCGTGISPGI